MASWMKKGRGGCFLGQARGLSRAERASAPVPSYTVVERSGLEGLSSEQVKAHPVHFRSS